MVAVNNAINLSSANPAPVGDSTLANWTFSAGFDVLSPVQITFKSYVGLSANGITVTPTSGSAFIDGTSLTLDSVTLNVGTTLANAINVGNTSAAIVLTGGIGSSFIDSTSLNLDAVAMTIGPTLMQTLFIGGLATTSLQGYSGGNIQWEANANFSVKSDTGNVTFSANSGQSIADGLTVSIGSFTSTSTTIDGITTLIGPTTCTNLAFGNAATVSSIVGTSFQVATTVSFLADAPDVEIANSSATIVTFGNLGADININADILNMIGNTMIDIDCVSSLQLGQADATTIQIGNSGVNTLDIIGQLPVDIGGSVAVMWNATTKQFYHA